MFFEPFKLTPPPLLFATSDNNSMQVISICQYYNSGLEAVVVIAKRLSHSCLVTTAPKQRVHKSTTTLSHFICLSLGGKVKDYLSFLIHTWCSELEVILAGDKSTLGAESYQPSLL